MLLPPRSRRLDRHGISDHSARYSVALQAARSDTGDAAELGRTGTSVSLRRRRHYLRRGSVAVEATGAKDRDRTALRRLLHRLPQRQEDRAPAVGPDYAARVRTGAGL